jgi:hypothetical protein
MSLFEHFFNVLSLHLEARIRIQIRIKVKGRIPDPHQSDKQDPDPQHWKLSGDTFLNIIYYPFVNFQVPLITTPSLQQPIMMASMLDPSGHKKS